MDNSDGAGSLGSYKPMLPFPITCLSTRNSSRYMLYDIDLITWLRREHHILGVLVGSLPQAPSQNVFLGLPLELMPEEARLLVDRKLAFIVDDRAWHFEALRKGVDKSKVKRYQAEIDQKGLDAAEAAKNARDSKLDEAMKRFNLDNEVKQRQKQKLMIFSEDRPPVVEDLLFGANETVQTPKEETSNRPLGSYAVTMTSSRALRSDNQSFEIQKTDPSSYAIFKLLHDKGYFLAPGLRFGCQYMAYPGDPLRYHSHFLATSSDWYKPINLIDIIGGGRLATGVKKSFLLGGIEESDSKATASSARAFSIEWAGM